MSYSLLTIQTLYADLANGNLSKLLSSMDANVVIHTPDSLPYGGMHQGRDGFVTLLSTLYATWSSLQFNPDTFIASGEVVVASGKFVGKIQSVDHSIHMPFVHIWKMSGDSITEIWYYVWDTTQLVYYLRQAKA